MDRELARLIRQSYRMTTFEMAEKLGVSLSSYTNFETGYSNSDLVEKAIHQRIPQSVIIEAEKLIRLTNEIKAEAAL